MTANATSQAVATRARTLLANGRYTGVLLRDVGAVGDALTVMVPGGEVHSWAVPVLAGDLLAGFFRVNPALTDWRFISFQRNKGSLAGCPSAAIWLDRSEIKRRAETVAQPGEVAMDPVLSFDRVPDRLAWSVHLVAENGSERLIFVAGRAVWPATEGTVDSYGGH